MAVRRDGRCICPLRDCAEPHITLRPPVLISHGRDADRHWGTAGWAIALVTQPFDVLRLPASYGAHLHQVLGSDCPTAIARSTKMWQFFLKPGSVSHDDASAAGGEVIGGSSAWIAAPGTEGEDADRYRWLVPPNLTNWQVNGEADAIRSVLATTDWSAANAPYRHLPAIIARALR
ncbi:hypothetical protein [Kribbella sp. DT2]|uniref:hypothetical protein n=1 Tax=Kribbella sp. DT2 TaxID=3393427 RepID=UPI003CEFDA18